MAWPCNVQECEDRVCSVPRPQQPPAGGVQGEHQAGRRPEEEQDHLQFIDYNLFIL